MNKRKLTEINQMICLLCLEKSIDFISIFSEESGLNVASIISKHFWLKPNENDSTSKHICYGCWHIIKSFHIFHTKIEVAHKNLTNVICKVNSSQAEKYLVKTEIDDNIRNDNIISQEKNNFEIVEKPTKTVEYSNSKTAKVFLERIEHLPISNDLKRITRRSVRNSESSKKEIVNFEVVKRKRRSRKIETIPEIILYQTIIPETISELPPVLLQIETEIIKNEEDLNADVIPEADEINEAAEINNEDEVAAEINDEDEVKIKEAAEINDEDEVKIKLKRRRNVLRNADAVDNKISKFMQLTCELCQTICPTLAGLKAHFRTVHETKGYAICCKKKFFKRYLLIDHIDTHMNPEHFKCKECDRVFAVADCLKRHVRELHKSEKCFYYCDKCPKKFARQMLLERHKVHHNPIEMWTFTCDECEKVFPSKFYLKSHKTFTHNKLPNKICHICGKGVQSNRYKKHLLEHDGITEPKIQCDICGAWLQKKYMGTHKINHREAEIIHSCTICGKISPNRRALYIHMRYTHAEQRNHECTVCSKTFKRRLALKQHMAIHTGDNLYKCTYCPKSFTYDSNFHNHKKKEHPKEHEEERKRNHRTDFVKCTQEKLQNSRTTKLNEQFDSFVEKVDNFN